MVQVSLSTSTNYDGEQNVLIEDQETALTVNFELDEAAPSGGLKVFVDSDVKQIVSRLDLPGFAFNPTAENINPSLVGTSFDNSGFFLTIDEGVTTASFTINVFDNAEPDTFLPETFDGLVEANFSLVVPGEVEQEDLADVGTLGDYTIDPDSASSTVIFADEESQLTDTFTPPTETPTEPPASDLPLVSLHTGPDFLVEENGTVSAHVFNVTGATIPEDGLVVSVSAPNISEFDLDGINVSEGGEIVDVREDGFDIRLTDFTVLVDLPVAADGEAEGLKTASFSLVAGDGYEVNEGFGSGEFTLVDTVEEIPDNFSEPNDTIPLASDIELSPDNSQVTISSAIDFDIGNRYENADGTFTYVDATEDVDFYQFDLKSGDIVSLDTNVKAPDGTNFFPVQRIFDADGNELAVNSDGQAPGELFATPYSYIEFEAPENGTYYVGVSAFTNGSPFRFSNAAPVFDQDVYDPFIPALGKGGESIGEYELTVTLNPDHLVILAEQRERSNNIPPETVDLSQPGEPTVSLNFLTGTYANFDDPRVVSGELNRDDLLNASLIEGYPNQGSTLTLVLETEGEIPEEGIPVTVNSDSYLRDYFSAISLGIPPFSPGSEFISTVADNTGRETGFQLRIFEPVTFFPLSTRTPYRGELLELGDDGLEFQPETDGPEEVTFYLEGGEDYGVSETANQVMPTFYDSEEQAGEPSVIPEVSLTISETELIESEDTETTLNFSLSEAPPEDGVLVYVKGQRGVLPQFDVLNAEVTGGIYPTANFNTSGFYFKITEQEASIKLGVFEDPFDEGLQGYSLVLQSAPTYTIDSDAAEVNFTIADTSDSVLEVSLSSESVAVESDNTAGLLTFNLTAFPPEEGITVKVDAPNLSEFDVNALTVTGGEITEITDTGFSLEITDAIATVELLPLSDSETEGLETATFSLVESESYQIRDNVSEAIITLVDIPEEVPSPTEEFDSNNTISQALELNLNSFNPSATVTGAFNVAESGVFRLPAFGIPQFVDQTEDVDFYSVALEAGQTVNIDIDTVPFEDERYPEVEQQVDSELRVFNAEGNELASVNNGAAPDEVFSRDPYLEFTASEAGTYYIGISQLGNTDYDPLVENNESVGSGWIFPEIGVFTGEYELNVELTSDGGGSEANFKPVFGSIDGDIIEMDGSNQLIFAGDMNDLVDTSTGEGDNRIYTGSGDDTLILGSSDRVLAGAGDDAIFFTSGGDNIITGGTGADQFWIASAELPESANIITDFTSGEDVLGIAGLNIGFDDLSITGEDDNTLIAVNGSDLAILQGIGADSLIADNFAFA